MSDSGIPSGPSRDLQPMTRFPSRMSQQRPGRPAQDEKGQAMSLHFVLNAVRQWWKVAAPVGLMLSVCAAGLVYWTFTPEYRATAWVHITRYVPYIAFQNANFHGDPAGYIASQAQLIRSPMVIEPVIAKREIAKLPEIQEQEDPYTWLSTHIEANFEGHTELNTVSFTGPDPQAAADIVNAIMDEYFKQHRESESKQTVKVAELLKEEESFRRTRVGDLRDKLRMETEDAAGYDPYAVESEQGLEEDATVTSLRGKLVSAEVEKVILEKRAEALRPKVADLKSLVDSLDTVNAPSPEAIAKHVADWMVEQAMAADPEIQMRDAVMRAEEERMKEIERLAIKGKQDPAYLQALKGINEEKDNRKAMRGEFCKRLLGEQLSTQEAELAALETAVENQDVLMSALNTRLGEQEEEAVEQRSITFNMVMAQRDLDHAEKVLNLITERRIAIETEQKATERVTLSKPAGVPKLPIEKTPFKKMLLAAMAGMLLPFGLAVLWEFLAKRVSNPQDLQRQSTLPVVGEIARIPSRARAAGGFASGAGGFALGMFEESIDSLRTNLVLSEDLKEMRVLAVTSAINHEGKTSVSAQLAISLARASGKKTLLIDGDMRCPDIHNVFGISLEPGLAEVLSGECSLEDAIVTDWSDHVHLIPAGKLQMSPHKLLGNGSAKDLLASVPDIYRYIVIDTPPVLAASEALVLAKAADATLICAMQDVSRIDQVAAACNRLESAGSRPVGTVLNGVPTKRYAYRYGSYAYSRQ